MPRHFDSRCITQTVVLAFAVLAWPASAWTQTRLEFAGANIPWTDSTFVDHSFFCFIVSGSPITETCYGFYPRDGGMKMFIGGPDVAQAPLRKSPSRFPQLTKAIRKQVTLAERTRVQQLVNDFNARNADFNQNTALDFVASVVRAIDWELPQIDPGETGQAYLQKVSFLNELKPSVPGSWTGTMTSGSRNVPFTIVFQMLPGTRTLTGQLLVSNANQGPCDGLLIKSDRTIKFSVGDGGQQMDFTGNVAADWRSMAGAFTSRAGNSGTWQITKQ